MFYSCFIQTGVALAADKDFMEQNPDFYPKLISNRMDVRWNALYAHFRCIRTQRPQIDKTYETVPAKLGRQLPDLDDEYWLLLDEKLALLDLYFNANLLFTVEDSPTLLSIWMAVLFLKKALSLPSVLTLYENIKRLLSGDRPESSTVIWSREHDQLHPLTQSAKGMLLKSLMQRCDFQNETRWSIESRDLMICSFALHPRFKQYAVHLCSQSPGEEYVWGVVKDTATENERFEKVSAADPAEVEVPVLQSPRKRIKTGLFGSLSWMKELQVQAAQCTHGGEVVHPGSS